MTHGGKAKANILVRCKVSIGEARDGPITFVTIEQPPHHASNPRDLGSVSRANVEVQRRLVHAKLSGRL
jgi:hypothetical protein